MKKIFETRAGKFALAGFFLTLSILFHTIGGVESGANYAVAVHPLFYFMIQGILTYGCVGFIYFGIKNQ